MTDEQHFGARYEAPAAGALENINVRKLMDHVGTAIDDAVKHNVFEPVSDEQATAAVLDMTKRMTASMPGVDPDSVVHNERSRRDEFRAKKRGTPKHQQRYAILQFYKGVRDPTVIRWVGLSWRKVKPLMKAAHKSLDETVMISMNVTVQKPVEFINLSMVIVPRTEAVEYEERDENDPI